MCVYEGVMCVELYASVAASQKSGEVPSSVEGTPEAPCSTCCPISLYQMSHAITHTTL